MACKDAIFKSRIVIVVCGSVVSLKEVLVPLGRKVLEG